MADNNSTSHQSTGTIDRRAQSLVSKERMVLIGWVLMITSAALMADSLRREYV